MSRNMKVLIAAATPVIVLGLVLMFSNRVRARVIPASGVCAENLRLIQTAKQKWAQENHKPAKYFPYWQDIQPYLGRSFSGLFPHCPDGGLYLPGRINQLPQCSVGGQGSEL